MTSYRAIADALSRWIDRVAATILAGRDALRAPPQVLLAEQPDGTFILQGTLQGEYSEASLRPVRITNGRVDPADAEYLAERLRGARVELVLRPGLFMFRPLELPRRALDFLDGIVRAQIDRLTPWPAAEAAYGWHPSVDAANDRIDVTIAATARALLEPLIKAMASLGADTVIVAAALPQPSLEMTAIRICEQKAGQAADLSRIRRILTGFAAGAAALASLSMAANAVIGGMLESHKDELNSRIEERRTALRHGHDATSEAMRDLERQKHEIPSSVIVIDALSQILPDDTYLTELRIQGDKVQMVGVTKDAPALIRLLEQTSHFSRATFYAPTTRSASEPKEHFHIEAHIEPVYTPAL